MDERPQTTVARHLRAGDEACEAVAAFMVDWNTIPPEDCAWRMYARLKTTLAHMEHQTYAE